MKKILFLWMCIALVLGLSTIAFAETVDEVVDETVDEVVDNTVEDGSEPTDGLVQEPTEDAVTEIGTEVYNTIFTRVFEFFETNKETIIMLTGFIASIFLSVKEAKRKKNTEAGMDQKQSVIISDLGGVVSAQNNVIDVVNALVEGYEKMKKKYEQYENAEDDRDKLVSAVAMQNETILEILASVVINNKNLPQGIKDALALKYARCEKAIDNDENLKNCMLAVKDALHAPSNEGEKGA